MKIRMTTGISGVVEHPHYENVRPGDIIEVSEIRGRGWVNDKLAVQVDDKTPVTQSCVRDPSAHY